jgi:hypothetical protein
MKSEVAVSISLFVITFALAASSFALVVALLSGVKFKKLHISSILADSVSADSITANRKISTKGTLSAGDLTATTVMAIENVTAQNVTAKNVAATDNVYATNGIFGNKASGNGFVYSNNATSAVPYFGALGSAYDAGYCWPGITSSNCTASPASA